MNKKELMLEFKQTLDKMYSIAEKKNADYSKNGAFDNFELVEKMWITTTSKWLLTRMADKFSRVCNLDGEEAQIVEETIEDTLVDLANYAILLKIHYKNKKSIRI